MNGQIDWLKRRKKHSEKYFITKTSREKINKENNTLGKIFKDKSTQRKK
jgi:hypothetical protein